ncbi:MAG: transposase [Candidatus Cloacimonetes bacterium]|jgi:REP element-mobilizing transposase RayT|nr:transposase [Candidatus Cloacimonadota bacterium]
MKRHNTIDTENPKAHYRSRSLPHWSNGLSPVFITYRLKFTLPAAKAIELNEMKTEWYKELQSLKSEAKEAKLKTKDGLFFAWFDELISKSDEVPHFLQEKEITDIIADSFRYFDRVRYELIAYCIMPNHVHVLILPLEQENGKAYPLSHITYTWKKFTAAAINRRLAKGGNLWQAESYDHLVRDELELDRVINYILQNPVKAGLVKKWQDWYGTWLNVAHPVK